MFDSVPSVLMSRFTLNLKELDSKNCDGLESNPSQFYSAIFRAPSRLVGNIGEQLEFAESDARIGVVEDEIDAHNPFDV